MNLALAPSMTGPVVPSTDPDWLLTMLGLTLAPAPRSSTHGWTPTALSSATHISLTTQESADSMSLTLRAHPPDLALEIPSSNILSSHILGSTALGSAVAHAPPGSHSWAASAALVPAAVDPPNSPDGPGPSPGLSPAFSLGSVGSVAAHAHLSIHGTSQTLSTLGHSVSHAPHRHLLFENMSSNATLKRSSHKPCIGPAADGPEDSINGLGSAIDGAEFGAGACTTFVDPWSVPGGVELDDASMSDKSRIGTGTCTCAPHSSTHGRASTAQSPTAHVHLTTQSPSP
jgi:hypothetical protein